MTPIKPPAARNSVTQLGRTQDHGSREASVCRGECSDGPPTSGPTPCAAPLVAPDRLGPQEELHRHELRNGAGARLEDIRGVGGSAQAVIAFAVWSRELEWARRRTAPPTSRHPQAAPTSAHAAAQPRKALRACARSVAQPCPGRCRAAAAASSTCVREAWPSFARAWTRAGRARPTVGKENRAPASHAAGVHANDESVVSVLLTRHGGGADLPSAAWNARAAC